MAVCNLTEAKAKAVCLAAKASAGDLVNTGNLYHDVQKDEDQTLADILHGVLKAKRLI